MSMKRSGANHASISSVLPHKSATCSCPSTMARTSRRGASSATDVRCFSSRVAETREIIRKRATMPDVGVPDIAEELRVSQRLLEATYRSVTGRTVAADLRAERLSRVENMLRKTQTPIDEIAHLCGFRSSCSLKSLFKREYGVTMSSFRRGNGRISPVN